jgi:type IV pilus assembly protein PilX
MQIQNRIHTRITSGAALVMSLILLSILSVLAITASQGTRTWIQAASNIRNADLAFQAAETGARNTEEFIASLETQPDTCLTIRDTCVVFQKDLLPINLTTVSSSWWTGIPSPQNKIATKKTGESRSVIEELTFVKDDLSEGNGPPSGVAFYRITTKSFQGRTGQATIQTVYSQRF